MKRVGSPEIQLKKTGVEVGSLTVAELQQLMAVAMQNASQPEVKQGALGGLLGGGGVQHLLKSLSARFGGQPMPTLPGAEVEVPRAAQKSAEKMLDTILKGGVFAEAQHLTGSNRLLDEPSSRVEQARHRHLAGDTRPAP